MYDKKYNVYLAGLINPECPATIKWRKDLIAKCQPHKSYRLLNPIAGENYDFCSKGIHSEAVNSKAIIAKDFASIIHSDAFIVDLNSYGSTRPLTGTLFELAWAWERHLPVHAVYTEKDRYIRNHPFIEEAVTAWFPNHEMALRHLERFFIRGE